MKAGRLGTAGIIFDLDGTLWDSSQQVAESWNVVLRRHPELHLTLTREDVMSVMGLSMTDIAKKVFAGRPEPEQLALLEECEVYENRYIEEHGGQLVPDLEATLQILSAEYPLFIMSNCQAGYIEAFLAHYDFGRYFRDHLCFGDNGKPKSVNIREIARRNGVDPYYYVGDIQADYDATAAAGGRFIHAAYGFGTIREPVPAIRSFAELPVRIRMLQERGE